jgi:N,N'-diacetyllegionaminate synthase
MVLVVAEIGMNHDGKWDRAYELLREAKDAGANVAKFQFGWRYSPGEINYIPQQLAERLRDWCDYLGIEFMTSVISDDTFDMAKSLNPSRYKIASRTITQNRALAERVLAEGKETFVSLGWWRREGNEGWPFGPPTDKLRYIFCQSTYPAYPADLKALPDRFSANEYYGFSDHSHGIAASLVAIARGAKFIEKHFTLDKTIVSVHNDHILSITPPELSQLVKLGRSMGSLVDVLEGRAPGVSGIPDLGLPK